MMILDDQRNDFIGSKRNTLKIKAEKSIQRRIFFTFLPFLKFNSFPGWLGVLHVPSGED